MFEANDYCRSRYVSPHEVPVVSGQGLEEWNRAHLSDFAVWNRLRDHSYCRCLSGAYTNAEGSVRYYFRCPGPDAAPDYCRQLVYTAFNRIQDGFGAGRRPLLFSAQK